MVIIRSPPPIVVPIIIIWIIIRRVVVRIAVAESQGDAIRIT